MAAPNLNISNRELRDIIDETFNDEELRLLCFELNIPYEDLGAEEKGAKVVKEFHYCEPNN